MSELRLILLVLLLSAAATHAPAETLRDPTRPDTQGAPDPVASEPAVRYRVTAIFYSEDRRVAVVNGRAVSRGDRIGAARVLDIGPDALTLDVAGRIVRARLARTTVRQ